MPMPMHACMHACMYVCRYVCMYTWMYVCVHVHIHTHIHMHMHLHEIWKINLKNLEICESGNLEIELSRFRDFWGFLSRFPE